MRCSARGKEQAVTNYPHLFSPLRIGNVTARNRIMQTAHVKLFATNAVDSQPDERYIYEGELERWEEATVPVA
jgi:hypothetical protein